MSRNSLRSSMSASVPIWVVVATVLFGTIINPLDGSMTSQALPSIASDLHTSGSLAMWTMSIYYLGSMASQPVMGRIADMFGARRIFVGGLFIVFLCCALMLVAPNIVMVIILRFVQSVGSAVAFPTGLSIVRQACLSQGESPDRHIGTITWVNSLAASVGPLFGGLLVARWGWRGPSVLTLAAALSAVIAGLMVLPRDSASGRDSKESLGDIDFTGIAYFVLTLSAVEVALTGGYGVPVTIGAVLLAVMLGAAFVTRELTSQTPFIDLRLLAARRDVLVVFFVYASANLVFFSVLTGLPTWLQGIRGLMPFTSGVATFPISIIGVIVTLIAGRFVYAQRQRMVLAVALGSMFAGSALLALSPTWIALVMVIVIAVMMASPNNISTLSLQTSLYKMIRSNETGLYTGLFQTSRYLGASLATMLTSLTVASVRLGASGLRVMGLACALVAFVAMAMSRLIHATHS